MRTTGLVRRLGAPGPLQSWLLAVAIALVSLCWIVGTPRSAGPDEPNHEIASAGMVRGDLEGEEYAPARSFSAFDVPAFVGAPDPACWVLAPGAEFTGRTPVGCADDWPRSTAIEPKLSRAGDYAPFAYVLPGLASYLPWPDGYAYLARIANALVPVTLVAASLVLLARRGLGAAALLGLTPIAWFAMSIVNPSGVAIGGGFALWTGLLLWGDGPGDASAPARLRPELLALAGWAALLLPRRDGPMWATMIVVAACLLTSRRPGGLFRGLGRRARAFVAVVAVLPLVTAALDRGKVLDVVLVLVPWTLIALDRVWAALDRLDRGTARWFVVLATPLVIAGGFAAVMVVRPGGYEPDTLRSIVGATDEHLRQWVGVLGWLDTPVPALAMWLYWLGLAGLVAVAAVRFPRAAAVAAAAVVVAILTAWALELGQGSDTGRYWQGRYTMPFAVGIPIAAMWRPAHRSPGARVPVQATAVAAWLVAVAAFTSAQRRWGVGVDGPRRPTRWHTWDTVVPPIPLVVVHALAIGLVCVLVVLADAASARSGAAAAPDNMVGLP